MARLDLYQQVTDAIVAELEKGVAPWVRPWKTLTHEFGGLPFNGYTRRPYRGVNVWLLEIARFKASYEDPRWFTLRQTNLLGGKVRRGEKATLVIFWKTHSFEETREETGERVERTVPLLRSYYLFNAAQCEGVPQNEVQEVTPAPELRYAQVKALLERTRATVQTGGDQAFFSPALDFIAMPALAAFETEEHYWGTMLHELTHWTGHSSRLARDLAGRFGSQAYAAEELVAEMGSAFLCAQLGVEGRLRHPEYVGHWLAVLKGDKRAVFTASSLAQRAADFVLDREVQAAPNDGTDSEEVP